MSFSISKLFGSKQKNDINNTQYQNSNISIAGTTPTGDLIVAKDVNWRQKAFHEAGVSSGDINAFHAGFQAAFEGIKKSQQLDNVLQEKMKTELQQDIEKLKGDKNNKETQLEAEETKLKDIESDLYDKNAEKTKVQDGNIRENKTNHVNLMIGASLIALLTIYLFIFYSSTAYSAFFRDWSIHIEEAMENDGEISIANKIFDGKAVIKAFQDKDNGVFAGLFVIFMPVVFMALGYVAHHTGKNNVGITKYAKVVLMYILTFAFDCLLAYNIAKNSYNAEIVLLQDTPQEYSPSMAMNDSNFWMVIFCGFVAYVIWGLLYGFVMDCYDKMKDNSILMKSIKDDIEDLRNRRITQQQEVTKLRMEVNNLMAKIAQKEQEFTSSVRYDFNSLKQHLADYYAGWCTYYAGAVLSTAPLSLAYDGEMSAVNNWMDNIKSRYKQNTEEKQ